MTDYRGPAATSETVQAADDGLMRSGPFGGLTPAIGDEFHIRVGDETNRYRLVGAEADGLVLLWQCLGRDR